MGGFIYSEERFLVEFLYSALYTLFVCMNWFKLF